MSKLPGRLRTLAAAALVALAAAGAGAQTAPFDRGWTLDREASALRVTSVKNGSVVETSAFAAFTGEIAPGGEATVRVLLDSIDTGIDLRNVRMRFLFFETFSHPEATVALTLDEAMVADLRAVARKTLTLPYRLTLHGVTRELSAEVAVSLLDENTVLVTSAAPLTLATEAFGLQENVRKLEEAAGVTIVPSGSVTFDFLFRRQDGAAPAPVAAAAPASVALETAGDFSVEECTGRFEILSRSGNIYFRTASARLDAASGPLLDSIADIVRRCPGLTVQVAGHTDSDGSDADNQRLSEARARAVADYLARAGIAEGRLVAVGYGESRPAFPNTSPENKRRNRRIEFSRYE